MSRLLINEYRKELETRKRYGGSNNEAAIRYAFATLLNGYCRPRDFILVEELSIESRLQTKIRLDGIVKDALRLDGDTGKPKTKRITETQKSKPNSVRVIPMIIFSLKIQKPPF
jgi:hypothetical protein